MQQMFCPRHFQLMEDHTEDTVLPCPAPIPVDPAKHVIASCGPCDRRVVIPVGRVLKGRSINNGTCQLDECAATVVQPEVAAPSIDQAAKPRDAKGKAK